MHHQQYCGVDATFVCWCRVLERYPDSGKLLKVYGRFVEFVQNDPAAARHYYASAMHHGTSDSMVKMVSAALAAAGSGRAGAAAEAVHEKVDGLVIVNAQGVLLLVNPAARGIFGYGKGEMEGKNISILM
jgi:PAS domain-containing protein